MNDNAVHDDMGEWKYDAPPTIFDFVQNNIFSNGVRVFLHCFVRLSLIFYHRFEAHNNKALSLITPCILAANHSSHLDVLALFSSFPISRINRLRSLAAKDYFFSNPMLMMIGFFFANVIPVSRGGISPKSMRYCGEKLAGGFSLIIFPEGTRTIDGKIHDFHPGTGMLALKYNVPIVPVYIDGTYQSQRKGMMLPRPKKIKIIFGNPIDYSGVENSKDGRQHVANDLKKQVTMLSDKIRKDYDDTKIED